MFNLFKPKTRYKLGYFCTALVWHCNLNCRYCDHFSPLAKEKFLGIKKLKKDFRQISKYIDVQNIGLMGGEPLLHPDLNNILKMTRKIFPDTVLTIYTNGILLNSMSEDFWKVCHENKIIIRISKYDVNLDERSIFTKAQKNRVWLEYYGAAQNEYKTMYKMALDLTGSQDKKEMHKICWQNKGSCNYFEDGKFYQCCVAGNIIHFNNYFNKNLEVTKKDYLDIYKVKKAEDIYKYFHSPIDFCRYCNMREQKQNLKFEISKKDINDWCL